MKMIDKIREQCIDMLEEQYATRMEILVNEELYDDAQAIVQEMVVPEYDINESDGKKTRVQKNFWVQLLIILNT
jgi:hypothetical protein